MQRRRFLSLVGGSAVLASCLDPSSTPTPAPNVAATADQTCNLTGTPQSTASVNLSQYFQSAAQVQQLDEWCWAACISMIFDYLGHPVTQAEIVSTVYGGIVDFPAPGMVLASALNRTWTDDKGVQFTCTVTGLYDAQSGIYGITNSEIISSLLAGYPLVFGANGHARVLVEVNYSPGVLDYQIGGAMVFDPGNGQLECLSAAEMTPITSGGLLTFLASIKVA